jgi:hypothetical protein
MSGIATHAALEQRVTSSTGVVHCHTVVGGTCTCTVTTFAVEVWRIINDSTPEIRHGERHQRHSNGTLNPSWVRWHFSLDFRSFVTTSRWHTRTDRARCRRHPSPYTHPSDPTTVAPTYTHTKPSSCRLVVTVSRHRHAPARVVRQPVHLAPPVPTVAVSVVVRPTRRMVVVTQAAVQHNLKTKISLVWCRRMMRSMYRRRNVRTTTLSMNTHTHRCHHSSWQHRHRVRERSASRCPRASCSKSQWRPLVRAHTPTYERVERHREAIHGD